MEKDRTYLAMEIHPAYAVFLDNRGRFIKAANRGYEVGDVTDTIVPLVYPSDRQRTRNVIMRMSVGIAACLCLGIFGGYEYWYLFVEYGNVHLQINPEIEISLSRSGRVLGVEGENEDGKALLEDYSYQGKEKETVVDELVERAAKQDYLADGGKIALVADAQDNEWAEKTETELSEALEQYLREQELEVQIITGSFIPEEPEKTPEETAPEEKKVLEEAQSVTIPAPEAVEETEVERSEESDDGITDYAVPPQSQPSVPAVTKPQSTAPVQETTKPEVRPSAPVQNDSGYGDDGGAESPYEPAGGNSGYGGDSESYGDDGADGAYGGGSGDDGDD